MQTRTQPTPLVVLAAGSLRNVFVEIISEFERQLGIPVHIEHGPASLLREKIEEGAMFDVFASANMTHPEKLHSLGLTGPALCFAQNRLCVIARRSLAVNEGNLIDVLADPEVRLGTSTPKADPSGDYAVEFFQNVERRHPGKGRLLAGKAQALVGGRNSAPIPKGATPASYLIGQGTVDAFISYASNGLLSEGDPDVVVVPLPEPLGPTAQYGVSLRRNAAGSAALFRNHLFTPTTKLALAGHGYVADGYLSSDAPVNARPRKFRSES
ncbi:molybdate ABC transporter substrate-binding protein [Rhizobium sp. VS19-DR104.2]|uniref:molybdate ABC transporter substrate-binding protein n=1 Tax=unclassified Rhizobium TaxID=2613769 RepID=UPI001C5B443C|nr:MULTISPECIES: molybdate ABC transporter substrate-binding protein [unclassified Rhizobium]MBZ5763074.1 molybdate ABC transporter substrate-binding protein [Rhizobium sp. VS19-DR96]MBZ5768950.1 molybdate ABC transporter substrate-binding protein [Rhizobium sp. VS19-DR129.2]MBZ5776568.1 molybdate ABC transporter substrate-binding protein [Rhizobium sp. VS19-DRK62.2]MBZ5787693.1 molybdate ABC transporter substrate-binding protein [Rhizobium sp. VS19-DR121]MBZ5805066.1 molybdate ABC transporter